MELLNYLPSATASFLTFYAFRHPKGKMGKKLPNYQFKNIQISPSIKIHYKGRVLHMHHWISCAILLAIAVPINHGVLDSTIAKGLLAGGILQGLTFKDAKRIIYKKINS